MILLTKFMLINLSGILGSAKFRWAKFCCGGLRCVELRSAKISLA